jgi:hypothetical protein
MNRPLQAITELAVLTAELRVVNGWQENTPMLALIFDHCPAILLPRDHVPVHPEDESACFDAVIQIEPGLATSPERWGAFKRACQQAGGPHAHNESLLGEWVFNLFAAHAQAPLASRPHRLRPR